MSLDLSQFKLRSLSLEVRYDNAFPIWDSCGALWSEIKAKLPSTRMVSVQPNEQTFALDEGLDAKTQLDKSLLTGWWLEDTERFRSVADVLFGATISTLNIKEFTRIGLRVVHERTFTTRELAADFVAEHHPDVKRSGKLLNIEGRLLDPSISLRWEGDTLGCSARLYSVEQRMESRMPREFPEVAHVDKKRNSVFIDVDYYAHAITPVSKFKASAIVENWFKIIRRDIGSFIDG